MEKESKRILINGIGDNYCIMIPIYYEYEDKPAWRRVFKGTKKECEKEFSTLPEYLNATHEENKKNREDMIDLYEFFISTHAYKYAEKNQKTVSFII